MVRLNSIVWKKNVLLTCGTFNKIIDLCVDFVGVFIESSVFASQCSLYIFNSIDQTLYIKREVSTNTRISCYSSRNPIHSKRSNNTIIRDSEYLLCSVSSPNNLILFASCWAFFFKRHARDANLFFSLRNFGRSLNGDSLTDVI